VLAAPTEIARNSFDISVTEVFRGLRHQMMRWTATTTCLPEEIQLTMQICAIWAGQARITWICPGPVVAS
jgi:hypothetical protein